MELWARFVVGIEDLGKSAGRTTGLLRERVVSLVGGSRVAFWQNTKGSVIV